MATVHVRAQIAQPGEVLSDGTSGPIEFTFAGKRFRIHAVLMATFIQMIKLAQYGK